ncbi:hypothetical protein D3C87_1845270 [compost metagenome]
MNRQHTPAPEGERLATQYAVTDLDAQFALSADMLFKRHNKTGCQRDLAQRRAA